MRIKTLHFIFALSISAFIISCSKTGTEGPQGPAGPSYTGTLSGNVSLFDQYGTRILTGLAGIKVSIIELNKSVKTDSNGHYNISNVKTGNYTYTVVDTTNVYGGDEMMNAEYIVGDVNRDWKLSAIPTFTLASCSAVDTVVQGNNYIKINCTPTASDTRNRTAVGFLGASSSVTATNYLLSYSKTLYAVPSIKNTLLLIPVADLYGAGIATGQTAYFSIYPAASAYASTSEYENDNTGSIIYNAIGVAPVVCSIMVP